MAVRQNQELTLKSYSLPSLYISETLMNDLLEAKMRLYNNLTLFYNVAMYRELWLMYRFWYDDS